MLPKRADGKAAWWPGGEGGCLRRFRGSARSGSTVLPHLEDDGRETQKPRAPQPLTVVEFNAKNAHESLSRLSNLTLVVALLLVVSQALFDGFSWRFAVTASMRATGVFLGYALLVWLSRLRGERYVRAFDWATGLSAMLTPSGVFVAFAVCEWDENSACAGDRHFGNQALFVVTMYGYYASSVLSTRWFPSLLASLVRLALFLLLVFPKMDPDDELYNRNAFAGTMVFVGTIFQTMVCWGRDKMLARAAKLYRAVERAKEEALQQELSKEQFMRFVLHEVRVPFSSVIMAAEELQGLINEAPDTPIHTTSESVDIMLSSGRSMMTLLNDVLTMASIESGRFSVRPRVFDVRRCVEKEVQALRRVAVSTGRDLRLIELPGMPRTAVGDWKRLAQVLRNLVTNALKFSPSGADVEITLGGHPGQLDVSVTDHGEGMSAEGIALLFQPYQQLAAGSKKSNSSGLGLVISQEIAKTHGGLITVQSEVGQGATFKLSLPIPKEEDSNPHRAMSESPPPSPQLPSASLLWSLLRGRRVLVVDDSEPGWKMMNRLFVRHGASAAHACNGAEALELVREHKFDLVFMDRMMPVMDGLECTTKLRAMGFSAPIVGLTACAMDDDLREFQACGLTATMTKPLRQTELARVLRGVLDASTRPALTPIMSPDRAPSPQEFETRPATPVLEQASSSSSRSLGSSTNSERRETIVVSPRSQRRDLP